MKNLALKEPGYQEVTVGDSLGPRTACADERFLRQGMFALDDYGSWYTHEFAPLGCRIVPSAMVLRDLHLLIGFYYDPARMMGLHQREIVRFFRPIPLGTQMVYEGRFTRKYVKRGKGYVVYEAEARDAASGAVLVSQVCTEIMRVSEQFGSTGDEIPTDMSRRIRPRTPHEKREAARAEPGIAVGTPIKGVSKSAFQDQMSVFSGCDFQWVNIHTSADRATEGGYRDTLLAGLMQTCWLSEMAAHFYGERWLYSGTIEHVYLKPVYHGDEITCHGVVVDATSEIDRLSIEAWTTNQGEEMTSAGWISCSLS
jgi:acyl dehydratase